MIDIESVISGLSPVDRARLEDVLDDRIADAKGAEASDINNGGITAQAAYLGLTGADLLNVLSAPEK
jgi:hypothetical protein